MRNSLWGLIIGLVIALPIVIIFNMGVVPSFLLGFVVTFIACEVISTIWPEDYYR